MGFTYEEILEQVDRELALRFSSPDDPGLFERRQRLKALFEAVPDDRAEGLRRQLSDRATADPLSKQFHGRLSTPTRRQMLGILDAKDGSAALIVEPTPAESELDEPADTFVSPSEPLPDDAHPRWRVARTALEAELAKVDDPRAERYQCWLATLQMGGDDRVIEWQAICPSTSGAIGAAAIVGPCELTGRNVDQTELEAAISSVEDVVPANERLSFITHLRPQIVRSHELTDFPVENFRQVHDQVQDAIRKLDVWANSPIPIDGADRAMPPAYIAIKDWIGRQQKNTDSVYSCF